MKKLSLGIVLFFTVVSFAQVGINTTTPEAQLDIKSSNQALPSNKDGLLIPKVDTFPATNPTLAQQGMLVYLTTDVGTNLAGFYYWNNSPASWLPIKGINGGTLDQAYDFGGAGLGKTITADAGAVLINGTDGFVSTGTFNSGAIAPSGAGTKMFWNPRKAAFRAGQVNFSQWDDANIGIYSFAFGESTEASGDYSAAFGFFTRASGDNATAFGGSNIASGDLSTAFGNATIASGNRSTAFGQSTTSSGFASTAFGNQNTASSFGETVIGIGATTYTPSTNGATQFRAANATDRLFVVGNALDANNNDFVDTAERSDAIIVLKSGLTRLPSTTNAMITAADGKAVVTKEYLQSTASGTLDQAYDFGGAGLGNTITADTGAVLIDGTDGLVSTGTSGTGAIAPSGAGTRMVWNPRKAAFRVGNVNGTQWDDSNIGLNSIAMGSGNLATGLFSIALGSGCIASGMNSVAFGLSANASATQSTAFGIGTSSTGLASTSFGVNNGSRSFGEVALGIGATTYTPTINGASQFRTANATDRLFVIGNAIDANNNNIVDVAERSDAMIVLKNGLTRLPSTTNTMIDAADGKAVVTKEYLGSNAWGLTGNAGTSSATNFIGTTDNVNLVFKRNNIMAGLLSTFNTSFGVSSLDSNTTGSQNSAFGSSSLSSNTTGFQNSAFGNSSLLSNTTGTQNSAFGYSSLSSNTIGTQNSAFGVFSLDSNTTGLKNSAFGFFTLDSNTTGFRNSAFGVNSLDANTTGVRNSAFGVESLLSNTTGSENLAFGDSSLGSNTTGNFNSAFGISALSVNTIGSKNTAIGFGANVSVNNLTNATAIGANAEVGASNSLVLGSINGVRGATATVNVGIGTTTPSSRLHVSNGSSGGTPVGTAGIVLESDIQVYQQFLTPSTRESGLLFGTEISNSRAGIIFNSGNPDGLSLRAGGNFTRMAIINTGDVGIGTLTPGGQFELSLNEGRKPGTNTWTIVSDQRLKTINGNYTKGLTEILQLNPIRFNYKNVGERKFEQKVLDTEFEGFIAQEVQSLFPDAVGTDADGFLNFNIHPILIASVNAFKELNVKYEELKTKNEELENKLTDLLIRIEKLENK